MKICFWGSIAGALKGKTDGGSELQTALLAKALARGGHEVVIIDFVTTEDFITDEGIKVLQIKGWNNGIRFIRFFTHRIPQLYSSLRKQNADIYYCRMRDFMHLSSFFSARKAKTRFILALASDLDAMGFRMRLKYDYRSNMSSLWLLFNGFLNEIIQPWLIRNADFVFVQHEGQRQILNKKGISPILFPNLIDINKIPVISNPVHNDFIYVGWLAKRKGIAEFFELVERSPSYTFKVIGPPRDKPGYFYYEKLKSYSNVSLLGELSHSETLHHIANSKALISTSPMEGFPNIFIEAWACGIPVLSLYFDPGSIIRSKGLGGVAEGDLNKLLDLMANIKNTDEFAGKAKAYIEKNHILNENKVKEICDLFDELNQDGKSGNIK